MWIRKLLLCVNFGVIGVHPQPGRAGGEAGVLAVVPLHRGAGVVAPDAVDLRERGQMCIRDRYYRPEAALEKFGSAPSAS